MGIGAEKDDIESRVQKLIIDQLDIDPSIVQLVSRFREDLGADSLDSVELIMALEQEFDIEIPDADADKMTTVQNVVDYIKEAKKKAEAA